VSSEVRQDLDGGSVTRGFRGRAVQPVLFGSVEFQPPSAPARSTTRLWWNSAYFVVLAIWSILGSWYGQRVVGFLSALVYLELTLAMIRVRKFTGGTVYSEDLARRVVPPLLELCARARCAVPKVVLRDDTLRAASVRQGPGSLRLVLSSVFMSRVDDRQLRAILAHEIVHISRRDLKWAKLRVWTALLIGVAGGTAFALADAGQVILPIFLAGYLVTFLASQVALSWLNRPLERRADSEGALLAGDPAGLAGALQIAQSFGEEARLLVHGSPPWRWLLSPLSWRFPTHPPMSERISALQDITRSQGFSASEPSPATSFGHGPVDKPVESNRLTDPSYVLPGWPPPQPPPGATTTAPNYWNYPPPGWTGPPAPAPRQPTIAAIATAIAPAIALVAASLIIVAHFRTDARLRREANPTIPAACIAPPNLSTEASTVFSGLTITDAQSVATVIANRIRAANFASSAVGVYVSDQTAAQHNTSIDPALGQHDPGLNNVATASLGTSPDLVYEITTVEQFDTAAQAIAYNQRIYEVRCEEHQNPTITPDPLGTFMLPQCTCTTGGGYSEMSTVVGPFRVGMDDYATNRTPQQLQALTEEALAST
jgi:heat shock protein HtpX